MCEELPSSLCGQSRDTAGEKGQVTSRAAAACRGVSWDMGLSVLNLRTSQAKRDYVGHLEVGHENRGEAGTRTRRATFEATGYIYI